ncbi:hypothetical protein ILUMI_25303 [Ignelater luminosus]|uniref:Reverse transcriptase domain-containing protein n=1 Tax=Ignelater luminosus TaxID=2038154 RepID=A0A8K0C5R3_IGNLU|nr:hypothetical protein ILUMI_25303 [Ignelater luminosus]
MKVSEGDIRGADAPFNDTDALVVTEKEVMNAILLFSNGSALGIDGLHPQHLKNILSNFTVNSRKRLLASITRLCNLMLRGKVNHAFTDILYGASLCTLSMKDEGIRPIARILSQVGAQQGDPAGPLLFCLVIQAVIKNLNFELNIFYLDDGTLGGDANTVLQDLNTIILGLQINPSKCDLYFCSTYKKDVYESFNQLSPGIKVLQDITLLGTPLNVQSTAKLLNQKHDEMRLLFSRLKLLQSHIAYFLLRNCFSIPKLTYLLKTSPACAAIELINVTDRSIKVVFESISNISFDEQQWCIASLSIKFGGLGLRKTSDIMLPAFLSSVTSVLGLITMMLQNITDETSFAVETLGPWSNSARNFVNELGHSMMVVTGDA